MKADYLPAFKFEGQLEELPLPVLIAYILDEKMTGTLHMESEGRKSWIHFDDGFPSGVRDPKSQDFLGSVLCEMGLIDDTAFNESLMTMAKEKRMQGEILVGMGKIDGEQLEQALSLQLARKLTRFFTFKSGSYHFIEDEELPASMDPIRVNPFALIHNGIRNYYGSQDLKLGLKAMVGKSCKVTRRYLERKELFEFTPEDLADAELLREFRLPQEFTRKAAGGPMSSMMLLVTLLSCGMLDIEEPDLAIPMRAAVPPPRRPAPERKARPAEVKPAPTKPAPAKPAPAKPAPTRTPPRRVTSNVSVTPELRKKIESKFFQIKDADLWDVLQVERDASPEMVKQAFLVQAKVFHPDRIANVPDEDLQHQISFISARLNEAFHILEDPETRAEYELRYGSARGMADRKDGASLQYQKALVFMKKKELNRAAEALRWAVDLDPHNPEYLSYRIWVDYLRKRGGDELEKALEAKNAMLKVAKANSSCFAASKFLYRFYKKLSDPTNFERAVAVAYRLDPKDVETAREKRLINLRKQKQRGLFGRKKKK